MFEDLIDELEVCVKALPPGTRYILGVAGIPASGKSTFAEKIVTVINEKFSDSSPAIVVPMDGFHYSNQILETKNLLQLKGIPNSFDAHAFVKLIEHLRTDTNHAIFAPMFDRSIESSIEGGIVVKPEHRLCVVEGNYLLLPHKPWSECRKFFDQVWYLDVSVDDVKPRLMERHLLARSESEALLKIQSTDLPNAQLISETKNRADKIIAQKNL